MDFGILGPLQLAWEGVPVPLPGRTLPRLLAVLLLEAGHVVPLPKLVDAVWEDDPPATARRQVQNTVATARGLLLQSGTSELETVGDGYRMRVRPEKLDSLRFQRAARIAREQVAASEPEAALASLREGLGLWRGPALAGLGGRVIEAGARRWEEERAAAEEFRAELELSLATGVSVVADLRGVLERHPYRQHAAELLMTALYRENRTAESLDVYESIRRQLADELGIDPGRHLKELHTAILRDDPALQAAPKPAPADRRSLPAPAQLPAVGVHFTGRAGQLAVLDRLLGPGPQVAVLSGIGGSGKTTLGLHWAHKVRERFPDGQLYVNLRGFDRTAPLSPLDAVAGFLRALGVPTESIPSDSDEAAALLRSRLADTGTLVVLDNARNSRQVLPLLPATAGCIAIVTSRSRLPDLAALHDVRQITVGALDSDESVRLLESLIGTDRVAREPGAARSIAALCGGLPLALRIVGTNLDGQPDTTLAETAAALAGHDRLSRLAVEGDPTTTVAAAFDLSYQALEPEEELLYLTLACLPGTDFSKDLACALVTWEPRSAERLLASLGATHRIEEYRPGRYRFHDLVREYARQKAESAFEPAALQRLREQTVEWYAKGTAQLPVEEYRNIIATFLEWNGHPTVSRLLTRLIDFADAGYREDGSERRALADSLYELPELAHVAERGIATGVRSDEPMDAVRAYALADAVAYASGDLHQSMAYAQKTLEHLRRTPHGDRTGKARNDLATTLTQLGRYREAVSLLREAVVAAEASEKRHVIVEVLTSLGTVLRRMGIFAEAEALLLRARELDAAAPGGPTTVYPLLSLSELYVDQGRISAAEELCRDIAELLRDHPSKYYRARLYFRQSAVHRADGDFPRAEAALLHGLELVEHVNGWRHQLVYTYWLAELYVDAQQIDQARDALERVAHLDRYQTSETLAVKARVLCKLYTADGDLGRAVRMGRQACDVFAAMPDPLRQARSLRALAAAYAAGGNEARSQELQAQARALYIALNLDASPTRPEDAHGDHGNITIGHDLATSPRDPSYGAIAAFTGRETGLADGMLFLGEGDRHREVIDAYRQVLEAMGFEIAESDPPLFGSFFQRFRIQSWGNHSQSRASKLAAAIDSAAEPDAPSDAPAQENPHVDRDLVEAVSRLIESIRFESDVVLQVDSILIIKHANQVAQRTLTPAEMSLLRGHWGGMEPPSDIRAILRSGDIDPACLTDPQPRGRHRKT
ncbi:MAG TPA: BTAD domain-containing putative transcriptional regulator [Glycomyces sp.]|nr:BTAD domain-containing putative transcriptional regulator [Glycomyces sp.]